MRSLLRDTAPEMRTRLPTDSLLDLLSRRIDEALRPLLQGYRICALLDFPNYSNVGDSAIWLGEERYLRSAGLKVTYRGEASHYMAQGLEGKIGRALILLSGGGNLGDLYPTHQHFRERIIRSFPSHRIIQLPQSIHFADLPNLSHARAIFNAHPDLTLLVRDWKSLEIARNEFRARSILCPDMALALGPCGRPRPSATKTMWLARRETDPEVKYRILPELRPGMERTDWWDDASSAVALDETFRWLVVRYPRWSGLCRRAIRGSYRPFARQRLARGLRLLARGEIVITDRLHGYILSLLMRIPHVVLDNSYGKVKSFHTTWTESSTITHWADSPEEALQTAMELASER